jgi:hypothetical protein
MRDRGAQALHRASVRDMSQELTACSLTAPGADGAVPAGDAIPLRGQLALPHGFALDDLATGVAHAWVVRGRGASTWTGSANTQFTFRSTLAGGAEHHKAAIRAPARANLKSNFEMIATKPKGLLCRMR